MISRCRSPLLSCSPKLGLFYTPIDVRLCRSSKYLAVKVVNVYDEEKRKQLLDELQTLMKFVSRFWVRFYGAFYDGSGAVYIALEYMDCGSLKDVLDKRGPIPERLMRRITLHIVHALK